jgi:hypothetical protein
MKPATLPRLAHILRSIRRHAQCRFSFEAIWISDSPTIEIRVTIDELVQLVEQSMLGTKTRYLID